MLEYLNERGQTRAQEVASEYARRNAEDQSPVSPISSPAPARKHQRAPQSADRHSTGMQSVDALTYIDEDFNYYSSSRKRDSPTDLPTAPLVANAAVPSVGGRQDLGTFFSVFDIWFSTQSFIEFADPYQQRKNPRGGILGNMLNDDSGRYPLEQQIENKRRGITRQQRPYVGLYTFLIRPTSSI